MSWLFSAGLVEAHSRANCSETPSSAQLSVMPTQHPFWRNDKPMEPSRFSRFGLTCEVLTGDRGEDLLTWFRGAFLARTSAWPAADTALTEGAADSGTRWRASFARWSPESFGWKTAQCSLLADSPESLATLPRWGSMRSGMLYLRQTLTHGICGNGSGSLPPTLCAVDTGAFFNKSDSPGAALRPTLGAMAKHNLWPTLVARDYRHPGRSRLERTGGTQGEHLPNTVGGPLNPEWCEWFMGFPLGWTASSALAMPKFHEWRQQHSPLSLPSSIEEGSMTGPCAKAITRCTLVTPEGEHIVGENWCANPQLVCPRLPGEDYTKCTTICQQQGHAEAVAIRLAGEKARGARAYLQGHTYACMACQHAMFGAGVISFSLGDPASKSSEP